MKIEIVAELAQGFEGCVQQTKLMVKAAAMAGADAVKFQLVFADELSTPDYEHYELFKTLEMSKDEWMEVKNMCSELSINLIFDVVGEIGLSLAQEMNIKTIKLHATDINNHGFLAKIANSDIERIMLGAGGAYSNEIDNALQILEHKEIVLFHGFQGYPTAIEENQISRIQLWREMYCAKPNIKLGFSDHIDPISISSISVPAFAVGQGALILEKHLTLGACMELEDFESAMNPDQFKVFVNSMRDLEKSYGTISKDPDFGMSENESQYRANIRRDVVSLRDIEVGTVIDISDVTLKRTSAKDSYKNIKDVYGKVAKTKIEPNKPISIKEVC
ncbi:N-acetylneuraminate synthase family protein [Gammaproteobacteria bacterium]|nr:N-acetylneuraminate synthase family protein [Gammaproteobacteria bacterium]